MRNGRRAKEGRQERAKARSVESARRTARQQLDRLNEFFGEDQGATKEREKLNRFLREEKRLSKVKKKKPKKTR